MIRIGCRTDLARPDQFVPPRAEHHCRDDQETDTADDPNGSPQLPCVRVELGVFVAPPWVVQRHEYQSKRNHNQYRRNHQDPIESRPRRRPSRRASGGGIRRLIRIGCHRSTPMSSERFRERSCSVRCNQHIRTSGSLTPMRPAKGPRQPASSWRRRPPDSSLRASEHQAVSCRRARRRPLRRW